MSCSCIERGGESCRKWWRRRHLCWFTAKLLCWTQLILRSYKVWWLSASLFHILAMAVLCCESIFSNAICQGWPTVTQTYSRLYGGLHKRFHSVGRLHCFVLMVRSQKESVPVICAVQCQLANCTLFINLCVCVVTRMTLCSKWNDSHSILYNIQSYLRMSYC